MEACAHASVTRGDQPVAPTIFFAFHVKTVLKPCTGCYEGGKAWVRGSGGETSIAGATQAFGFVWERHAVPLPYKMRDISCVPRASRAPRENGSTILGLGLRAFPWNQSPHGSENQIPWGHPCQHIFEAS